MENKSLELILKNIGFSDKESRVYLALLELGAAGVQDISKKSKVNRATTYVILESLKKQGAVSIAERDKKIVFIAESPRTLLRIFQKHEQDIKEKENEFKKAIPELEALYNLATEKPTVRFFEGKEGVRNIRQEIIKLNVKIVYNIYSYEYVKEILDLFPKEEIEEFTKNRLALGAEIRSIYTSENGPVDTFQLKGMRRFVPKEKFPFSSDILIYADRVAFTTLRGTIISVIIQSKEIADTLKLVFELAWRGAEQE